MALKTVTGKLTDGSGNAVPYPKVRATLSAPAVIANTQEVAPAAVPGVGLADGTWSIVLQSNLDLTPNTTSWHVEAGSTWDCIAVVPSSPGPFPIETIMAAAPAVSPPAALDSAVVHLALSETITGVKDFANGFHVRTVTRLFQALGRNWPGVAGLPTLMSGQPTVTLSAANAATSVAGSAMRGLNDGANHYIPGLVNYGGAPLTAAASIFWIRGTWTEEGATYFYIDFMTDSPKFEVVVSGNGQYWRGLENGQFYTAQAAQITADGNTYRILVDHAGVRAMRSYRFEFTNTGANIQGIQLLPTDTLIPGVRRGPRVIVIGDSFSEGNNATDQTTDWVQLLSWLTGWDCWALAEGGTGYLQTNVPSGRTKAAGHLADVTSNAPDLVLWALGINDYNNFSGAAIQAEATADYATIQAALPGVPQIVLGPFVGTNNQYNGANFLAARNALQAAAVAAGLPFADPIGTGYLKGTGKVGATTGDGNADFLVSNDGTHPSQAGHDALARVVASTVAAALRG